MKKNTIFITATVLGFFIFSFLGNSHAQESVGDQLQSEFGAFIFVQTFVENSEGQFVTYLNSDKFTDLNIDALEELLENEASENDPIVTIDQKQFQIVKRKLTITYDKENVIASTILASNTDGQLTTVARFAHDGYPIVQGDTVHSIWTFVTPLD